LKKSQPSAAIENGFTSQFTNSVIRMPRGRLRTSRTLARSMRSIIG
jgi:hypothetical protein